MKKAVYIGIFIFIFSFVAFANEPVEISSVSSPEYVLRGEFFTLSSKIVKPQSDQSFQLYLHTNFDVSLKSVQLTGLSLSKKLRFYRIDVNTDYDKVYKIESGDLKETDDQLFQVNFTLSSSSNKNVDLFLSDDENLYDDEQKERQTREVKIYNETSNSGGSLQLDEDSKVDFKFSTDDYDSENILIEFWAKLYNNQSKFISIEDGNGEELTSLSITNFGYLSVPNFLDAEYFDELYIDQSNWNYFLIKLNDNSGELRIYLNDNLFYKGICSELINKTDFGLQLLNESGNSESQFDRLKVWSYNNSERFSLQNKNFNSYTADSSSIILQNNFDATNSLSEIEHTGNIELKESDAPIFSRAPNLNVVLIGQSYNLSWEISELSDVQKFVVEKSYDGRNYFEVSAVQVVDESKTMYSISDYDYTDNQIIYYRIKQVNNDETDIYSSNVKVGRGQVKHFSLQQNYPNPFNPITTVSVQVDEAAEFEVVVYDIVGKTVAKLHNGPLSEGIHRFTFDGTDLPSGLYLCEVKSGDALEVMKMILAK